jgi:hypothetical protein
MLPLILTFKKSQNCLIIKLHHTKNCRVQLYRDSIYKLCIDRMNGWITEKEYDAEKKDKYILAIDLIKAELPVMGKTVETFFTNVKAGESKINIDDIVKLLEAQKEEAKAPSPNIVQKPQE